MRQQHHRIITLTNEDILRCIANVPHLLLMQILRNVEQLAHDGIDEAFSANNGRLIMQQLSQRKIVTLFHMQGNNVGSLRFRFEVQLMLMYEHLIFLAVRLQSLRELGISNQLGPDFHNVL